MVVNSNGEQARRERWCRDFEQAPPVAGGQSWFGALGRGWPETSGGQSGDVIFRAGAIVLFEQPLLSGPWGRAFLAKLVRVGDKFLQARPAQVGNLCRKIAPRWFATTCNRKNPQMQRSTQMRGNPYTEMNLKSFSAEVFVGKNHYGAVRLGGGLLLAASAPKKDLRARGAGPKIAPPETNLSDANIETGNFRHAQARESSLTRTPQDTTPETIRKPRQRRILSPLELEARAAAQEKFRREKVEEYERVLREIINQPQRTGEPFTISKLRRKREVLLFGRALKISDEVVAILNLAMANSNLGELLNQCFWSVLTLDRDADVHLSIRRLLPVIRFLKKGLPQSKLQTLRKQAELLQLELALSGEAR